MTPTPELNDNKQVDSVSEATNANEAKESDVKKLDQVDAKKLGTILEKNVSLEIKKDDTTTSSETKLSPDAQKVLDYQNKKLSVDATTARTYEEKIVKSESKTTPYTVDFLTLRDMDSNKTEIPAQYRDQILQKITTLGAFEKIKIIGCTDSSPIATPAEIEGNKKAFNEARNAYIAKGGDCPSYDQLLQSPQDPQNTILGYMRAMKGVISLGELSPDQMKKIEISNKLGTVEKNAQERGFDIAVDYKKTIEHGVQSLVLSKMYDMYGALDQNSISWVYEGDSYTLNNLNLKTYDLDPQDPSALYMQVVRNAPQVAALGQEDFVKTQITSFLKGMIDARGGKYNNGVWSAEGISKDQYFMIASVRDGLLSKDEFISLNTQKDPSILESKQLSLGKTVKQFINDNMGNKLSFSKMLNGKFFCNVLDAKNVTTNVQISKNDYILFGLYAASQKH